MLIAVFIVCYSFSRIGCYYFVCTSSVFNAIWIDACGIAVFIDLNPKVALMIRFSLPWLHSITLFLYLTCLCSRSGGHFLSHFNRDKAPPYVCFMALLHKPICKGFFSDIIFKWRSLHIKSTAQPIGPHITELSLIVGILPFVLIPKPNGMQNHKAGTDEIKLISIQRFNAF